MAPKLPPCKICNKKDIGKYKCPICQLDYCSVICYKSHKLTNCTSTTSYIPKPITSHPVIISEEASTSNSDRPNKRLRDLNWPLEPEESLWDNPLHRDDLKPLRNFEFEAIAKSKKLRTLLNSPNLIQTLTRLKNLPNYIAEPSLRLLLNLSPDLISTLYRPSMGSIDKFSSSSNVQNSQAFKGRNNGRGGGGGGGGGRSGGRNGNGNNNSSGRESKEEEWKQRGLLESTAEERSEVEKFVQEVISCLEEVRAEKGEI